MPKGYWIGRVDVNDPQAYQRYATANAVAYKKYGARFVIRAGRFETVEGQSRARNVVIEFPSYQAAMDCWNSPEYQDAAKIRQPISIIDLIIVEGYDGPQLD
ncbi:DUF1330 domain-containing protein [Pseudomonas fluorescens]|uniref:DUF1330 domain-containing protein n=1 Tax=Pseudomonas fluorescens TaxID=294 RepID=A0A5E7ARD9_PSEFL|nr:DUF1330 domain-containing protein [Pseudomonas fluorescens]VVN81616.1 hypothetical protein PS723_01136 [Pseudomonas fluorescens]